MTAASEDLVLQMLDREAIRAVYVRYARGLDRADAGLVSSAYHTDAVEDHHGETYEGSKIGAILTAHVLEGMNRTHTHITNVTIALDGDKAGCEAYYMGLHLMKSGKRLMSSGRSLDRLERRDGEWRFVYRSILPDMVRILPGDEIVVGEPVSRRDPSDPSYEILRCGK